MRKVLASVALAAAVIVPSLASAAEEEKAPNTGALSLSGGADYVSEYFFRGVKQTPAGFIVEPWAQLNVSAYKTDDLSITPYVGTWNNVQDTKPAGTSKCWTESDIYGGIDVGLPAGFKVGAIYTLYTSPSDAFKTSGELGGKLSYDDTEVMKKIGSPVTIQPYAAWYYLTFNDGGGTNQYAELGLTPTVAIGDTKLTATLPIVAGFSPDGTYQKASGKNTGFGYWSVGAFLGYPLPLPAKFGTVTVNGGVTYIQDVATSARAANNNDGHEVIAKIGMAFSY